MEGSDQGFSSSTPLKPCATPKHSSSSDAAGCDENDHNHHQAGAKLQNPKTSVKNFMTPTISADSKAVAPRKKILAERNKASESIPTGTELHKTPNLDSKTHSANPSIYSSDISLSQVTPFNELLSMASQSEDEELKTFNSNLSSQPYDPLTNYLSPRPKYLRYKPNRRQEIFLRQENKLREGKDGLGTNKSVSFDSEKAIGDDEMTSASVSFDSSQGGFLKQESKEVVEELDDEGDENEELEEQGTWIWKGVLKTLLVIAVFIFSSSYISFMNSPTPSPASQAIESLKDGYQMIQQHIFGAASMKSLEKGNEFVDQREEIETVGFGELNQRDIDEGLEEGSAEDEINGIVEHSKAFGEVEEQQDGTIEGVSGHKMDGAEEVSGQMARSIDFEGVEEFGEVLEQQDGATEGVSSHKMEGTQEVSDRTARIIELEGIETASYPESLQAHRGGSFDWEDHHNTVFDDEFMATGTTSKDENDLDEDHMGQVGAISCEEAGKCDFGDNEMEMEMAEDTIAHSFGDNAIMVEENTEIGVSDLEKEGNMKEAIESIGTESISKTVIGVSIMFVIVSTVLGFYFRGRRISSKDSSSNANPSSEPVVAVKSSSELLIEREKQIEGVDSFENPSSSTHSFRESSKAFQQSRAPTVELIGEFFVEHTSSSRKNRSVKSKMLEEEESNFSVSRGKSFRSKVHTVTVHVQESPSEFSSIDSTSYGSFRGQKDILMKEEGNVEETMKVVTTPVRRSSRLRNRALSPSTIGTH